MIEWFTWAQVAVALLVGLACVGFAIAGRGPNDYTLAGLALVELLLVAQIVVAIAAPAFGNVPAGSGLEFWMYLVTAAIIPPAAAVWALVERSRWSTLVMATAALAIAVMVWRMHTIWFFQVA